MGRGAARRQKLFDCQQAARAYLVCLYVRKAVRLAATLRFMAALGLQSRLPHGNVLLVISFAV